MIERPALRQPRPKVNWPVLPPGLPRTVSASTQILQVALIILGIALVTFILYLYLLPNSQISEKEAQIGQLKAQHATLVRQNAEIVRQVSAYTDLGTVQQRAKKLGMAPARNVIFLPAIATEELLTHEQTQLQTGNTLTPSSPVDQSPAPRHGGWLELLKTRGAALLRQLPLRVAAPH